MKNKKLITLVIAAVVILAAVLAGIGIYNAPANRIARQMDVADKYLADMDYEQAVVEFTKAIEIDPMNVDAYLGLAEAYEGLRDYDKTYETLQQGYDLTGDERLKERMDEMEGQNVGYQSLEDLMHYKNEAYGLVQMSQSVLDVDQQDYPYCIEWYPIYGDGDEIKLYEELDKIYEEHALEGGGFDLDARLSYYFIGINFFNPREEIIGCYTSSDALAKGEYETREEDCMLNGISYHFKCYYNKWGYIVGAENMAENSLSIHYNPGYITQEDSYAPDGSWMDYEYYINRYDDQGNLIKEKWYDHLAGDLEGRSYTINATTVMKRSQPTFSFVSNTSIRRESHNMPRGELPNKPVGDSYYQRRYGEQGPGGIGKSWTYVGDILISYHETHYADSYREIDDEGSYMEKIIKSEVYEYNSDGSLYISQITDYNESGYEVSETWCHYENGKLYTSSVSSYDESGHLISTEYVVRPEQIHSVSRY